MARGWNGGVMTLGCAAHAPEDEASALAEGKLAARTVRPVGHEAPDVGLWTAEDEPTTLGALIEKAG